jgi:hypothetical protein
MHGMDVVWKEVMIYFKMWLAVLAFSAVTMAVDLIIERVTRR